MIISIGLKIQDEFRDIMHQCPIIFKKALDIKDVINNSFEPSSLLVEHKRAFKNGIIELCSFHDDWAYRFWQDYQNEIKLKLNKTYNFLEIHLNNNTLESIKSSNYWSQKLLAEIENSYMSTIDVLKYCIDTEFKCFDYSVKTIDLCFEVEKLAMYLENISRHSYLMMMELLKIFDQKTLLN